MNEHPQALADFSKAIELQPKLASAYRNRGATYLFLGDEAKARADFSAALAIEPNNTERIPEGYGKR